MSALLRYLVRPGFTIQLFLCALSVNGGDTGIKLQDSLCRNTLTQGTDSAGYDVQSSFAADSPVEGLPDYYRIKGEVVTLVRDRDLDGNMESGDGDAVWVFAGQQRGGRSLYAFDMTNPDSPQLKWKIDHRTPGFEQLAMTFSTPRVARLNTGGTIARAVLIFGGGYNGGWEGGLPVGKDAGSANDLIGNAVFVVDADTGELVWKATGPGRAATAETTPNHSYVATLTDSIPSPLTVVDVNGDGFSDRAYVGDTGGNIWRVDFRRAFYGQPDGRTPGTDEWALRRLAILGGEDAMDRRFFYAPDFVRTRDGEGDYDGIVIVSGNLADPLSAGVQNFAYLIKDRDTAASPSAAAAAATPITHAQLVDVGSTCVTGEETQCLAANLPWGWRLPLAASGEKGLSRPLVSNGVVLFTSFAPVKADTINPCGVNGGLSRVYKVVLRNAASSSRPSAVLDPGDPHRRSWVIGPGLAGDVLPYQEKVLIPATGVVDSQVLEVPGRRLWRVYWREESVDAQ